MSTIFNTAQRSFGMRQSTLRSTSSVVATTSLECVALPVTNVATTRNTGAAGAHEQGSLAWSPPV